ncbi:MAG: hypothetical protein N2044_11020 [Cyclobacteriaceae bacterium]|nr:hypothetical protein [Cyclobacteriaceae bacterium]
MFVHIGTFKIERDYIIVENYPFAPSIAYKNKRLGADEIQNMDLQAAPPTLRIGNELIFVSADKKDQLQHFAALNNIPVIKRADIWDWILEPFLDTEYTEQTHKRLTDLLAKYGLTEDEVSAIREEVKAPMLKYNFGTMLWEWTHLGAWDVLCAMRLVYDDVQFSGFYRRVMDIALLPDNYPV